MALSNKSNIFLRGAMDTYEERRNSERAAELDQLFAIYRKQTEHIELVDKVKKLWLQELKNIQKNYVKMYKVLATLESR